MRAGSSPSGEARRRPLLYALAAMCLGPAALPLLLPLWLWRRRLERVSRGGEEADMPQGLNTERFGFFPPHCLMILAERRTSHLTAAPGLLAPCAVVHAAVARQRRFSLLRRDLPRLGWGAAALSRIPALV